MNQRAPLLPVLQLGLSTMNVCSRHVYCLPLALVVLSMFPLAGFAQDEPDSASDTQKSESVTVTGVLEAIVAHELTPDGEQIDAWVLKRILPHGSTVKKGDPVVWFNTESAEKKLKAAETELRLAKLALEDDEFKHRQFLSAQRLDQEAAARAMKKARQDHDHFVQIDRPRMTRTAKYNIESSIASLENAQEELHQLEQMYKEDDLTEESEEIVLKRAKRAVESAEYRLEGTKIASEQMLKRGIAEQAAQQAESLARAELTHQQTVRDLASARQKREIEMAKARAAFQEQEKKLEELRAERQRAVINSPINGVVLHGKLTRGRISEKASVLGADSKLTAEQVIATIVDTTKLQVRVDLAETNLSRLQVGQNGSVSVAAVPAFAGSGVVKSVSRVPYAGTKYDCVVALKKSKQAGLLMPTMTCTLEFANDETSKDDDAK
ncbi:MAG: HlyD family efflux transporter periplasmic adaptor subunit [Rubripirellula sp.]|jgi:multidrug resistance efflux pump|nr:HlyD family efflux transporter periplasmic adaptor subunit [Rubripirellula sp.]